MNSLVLYVNSDAAQATCSSFMAGNGRHPSAFQSSRVQSPGFAVYRIYANKTEGGNFKSGMRTIESRKFQEVNFLPLIGCYVVMELEVLEEFCCTTTTRPKTVLYLIFTSTAKVQLG